MLLKSRVFGPTSTSFCLLLRRDLVLRCDSLPVEVPPPTITLVRVPTCVPTASSVTASYVRARCASMSGVRHSEVGVEMQQRNPLHASGRPGPRARPAASSSAALRRVARLSLASTNVMWSEDVDVASASIKFRPRVFFLQFSLHALAPLSLLMCLASQYAVYHN